MTHDVFEQRKVDARICALSSAAFIKDSDLAGAATAMSIYYTAWSHCPRCLIEAMNDVVAAFLAISVEIAESSDVFRAMAVDLVGSDG